MAIDNLVFDRSAWPWTRRQARKSVDTPALVQGDPLAAFRSGLARRSGCFSCCRIARWKSTEAEKFRHRRTVLTKHEQQPADRLESAADVHIAPDLYARLNSRIALTW